MAAIVGVIMGSDSDWAIMKQAVSVLKEFGISYEVVVASAHRTPEDVKAFIERLEAQGAVAFIAGAGAAAHLPGVVASHTIVPVIGVPIDATCLKGMDALLSIVQMPSGMPVATMAINGSKNAALFAVQMVARFDAVVATAYATYREEMARKVRAKNEALQNELNGKAE